MSKGKSAAMDLLIAIMIGVLVYLPGQMLLALLVVEGYLPEARIPAAQMFLGMAGAFLGGLWAVRKLLIGALPAAAATAAGMGAVIILLGTMCYEEMAPVGTVALRLAFMAAGALLAGVSSVGWSGRRRKHRSVRIRKPKK